VYQPASSLAVALLLAASASAAESPSPFDLAKAEAEVKRSYAKAHPEIQEYVLWTAKSFGPPGLWLNEDAFEELSDDQRAERVAYLARLFEEAEYGRHLCDKLAAASALKDERLLPGLMKVAAYHRDDADYDCRAKWMAVAALARQESEDAVPLLVSLVDHGNQNTRMWARAALARITGQDFNQDKKRWATWWEAEGHDRIDAALLKPWPKPSDAQ
jgi:HEAT repeat protein